MTTRRGLSVRSGDETPVLPSHFLSAPTGLGRRAAGRWRGAPGARWAPGCGGAAGGGQGRGPGLSAARPAPPRPSGAGPGSAAARSLPPSGRAVTCRRPRTEPGGASQPQLRAAAAQRPGPAASRGAGAGPGRACVSMAIASRPGGTVAILRGALAPPCPAPPPPSSSSSGRVRLAPADQGELCPAELGRERALPGPGPRPLWRRAWALGCGPVPVAARCSRMGGCLFRSTVKASLPTKVSAVKRIHVEYAANADVEKSRETLVSEVAWESATGQQVGLVQTLWEITNRWSTQEESATRGKAPTIWSHALERKERRGNEA
ncbi:uncharacterized protein LOC110393500 [Numida meleagris]|uniref:uncharacterized protein LOC110393500 n=1 Tax=Numida meleagris TaxID=8996 RepID=UPI000B3DBBE0|nr:uncharacterized protein LOC110393500 [Numida meleagris]